MDMIDFFTQFLFECGVLVEEEKGAAKKRKRDGTTQRGTEASADYA